MLSRIVFLLHADAGRWSSGGGVGVLAREDRGEEPSEVRLEVSSEKSMVALREGARPARKAFVQQHVAITERARCR